MKKLIILCFICAAGIISCGKKIMPESDANNQTRPANDKEAKAATQMATTNMQTTTTNTQTATTNTTLTTTAPSFNNMQSSGAIPMDQEKTVYVTKCNSCHALKNPGDYTADQMKNILKAEIPKAKLNKKEAEQVTAYLLANTKK